MSSKEMEAVGVNNYFKMFSMKGVEKLVAMEGCKVQDFFFRMGNAQVYLYTHKNDPSQGERG